MDRPTPQSAGPNRPRHANVEEAPGPAEVLFGDDHREVEPRFGGAAWVERVCLPRWWQLPAAQQPAWPDRAALRDAVSELRRRPALVAARECERLRARLAAVALGEAFLLQAGECAETFAGVRAGSVVATMETVLSMAVMLRQLVGVEPVVVGRMAGQFAKPRSESTELYGDARLPAYRGDAVNDVHPAAAGRRPDPGRLLAAYDSSAVVLRQLRGWADSARPYPVGIGEDVFTSHEALLLDYEAALLRPVPGGVQEYASSGHLLWIGDRTRQLDGAHVGFGRHVANPIAVKLGPTATPAEATALVRRLDPHRQPGRLTFVTRFGADRVRDLLFPIVAAVTESGARVGWVCDPMHGNTRRAASGRKTRRLPDILAEIDGFFEVHRSLGTWPGGLHLEVSGEDVTECVGGGLQEADLGRRYETVCDPRLNPRQCLDLVAGMAEMFGNPWQHRQLPTSA